MTTVNKWKKVKLLSLESPDNVQISSDDYQFVMVNGKDGRPASRIIVDRDGNLRHSTIGMQHPTLKPEIVNVRLTSRNDEGTMMPRGNVLMICYTYVNDQEEESNPSPVLVVDDIQYQAKGHYTKDGEIYYYPIAGGTYVYTQDKVGSIDSIVLNVPIDSAEVKRVNIYVADAEYVESIIPPSGLRLISSQIIRAGLQTATIVISSSRSPVAANYENDMAAKGDAITLIDGITFIGNAVKGIGLVGEPEKVWAITLSNKNKYNYINRWLRLDLLDEAGIKPVGEQVFTGLNWNTDNKKLFRLMDSDLITPLECYHYPLDAQLKMHREIFVSGDATRASGMLLFPLGVPPSVLTVYAKRYGATGNELSINLDIGTTVATIQCDHDAEINDKIVLRTYLGVYHAKIILKEPSGTGSLSLSHSVDGNKHTIEITPASTDGVATSTAWDIYSLLVNEYESDEGELYEIISEVYMESLGEFDNEYIPSAQTSYFASSETLAGGADKTTVWLAYDSLANEGNGAILSKVTDVANAINNVAEGKIYAAASFGPALATLYPEVFLSGGSGIAPVNPSDVIQTRMHCFVRIPQMLSFQEKTIYLVKFKDEPANIECPLTGMSVIVEPGGIGVSNFYEQKLLKNPLYGEGDTATTREVSPSIVQDDLSKANAANIFFDGNGWSGATKVAETNAQIDEYCRNSGVQAEYPWAAYEMADVYGFYYNYAKTGAPLPREGHMSAILPTAYPYFNEPYIMVASIKTDGTLNKKNLIGIGYDSRLGGTERLCIYVYDKSGNKRTRVINWIDLAVGKELSVLLSWRIDSEQAEAIEMSLSVSDGTNYRSGKETISASMDTAGIVAMFYAGNTGGSPLGLPLHTRLISLRKDMFIENEWQALNLLKFLSFYPTEGIGVYDEFRENTDGGISVVNKNTDIQTITFNQDMKPGRIQWGAYGAMPDLNEYNINEDIMALIPVKSFQPTDEHNTIIVLTKTNTYIFALLGNSAKGCSLTKAVSGIGIVNRKAYCTTNSGVAWLSHRGVMHISASGIKNLSEGVIDVQGIDTIVYDQKRNWIWARGDNKTYVFQERESVWWEYEGEVQPDGFLGDMNGWISHKDNTIYIDGTGRTNTLIKTRALNTVKKLGRITLSGKYMDSAIRMKAKMYSNKITGMATETAEVTARTNSPTAIPGVSADFVQIEIADATDISGALIEYEDGLR